MFAFERGFRNRKCSVVVLAKVCDYEYIDVLVFLTSRNAID